MNVMGWEQYAAQEAALSDWTPCDEHEHCLGCDCCLNDGEAVELHWVPDRTFPEFYPAQDPLCGKCFDIIDADMAKESPL
jgi:hypothetical protein